MWTPPSTISPVWSTGILTGPSSRRRQSTAKWPWMSKTMAFHDWAEKKEYLPCIDYLKTDAAEAEILTGLTDRAEAAKLLHQWGAKEVLITHNTEVLVYDGREIYTCPIKARNLSGRTGRGDTTFAGYITERQRAGIEDALLYCTALVSLKMETPGPFQGSRDDVLAYIAEFYR